MRGSNGEDVLARYVELRRHTDNDGDMLTAEGVQAAVALGELLSGCYQVIVSSGAQRATQTAACVIAGLGERIPDGVVVSLACGRPWRISGERHIGLRAQATSDRC